jgi:hypothetical protein
MATAVGAALRATAGAGERPAQLTKTPAGSEEGGRGEALHVLYIVMVHWQEVTAFAGAAWPLERSKEAAWGEFSRAWNDEAGVTFASEFKCDLGCVRTQLFGDGEVQVQVSIL